MLKEPKQNGFQALDLLPATLAALERANYRQPTPIQAALIPHALEGYDIIGQAQTGTGKTAAFLLPFLDTWEPDLGQGPQALILAPTRELVVQIYQEATRLTPYRECRSLPIYGGQRFKQQLDGLRQGIAIAIGTPGRVLDHIGRGTLCLDQVDYVVLDEADRMLDIGFRPDIEKILRRCPTDRQTLLMSATVPPPVLRLTTRYMVDPIHINLAPRRVTVEKIKQTHITVEENRKFELLLHVLDREKPRQCIIFCQRKRSADELFRALRQRHPGAAAMHGDLPQPQRERIMQALRDGKVNILVATDVVGRGIDVTNISHIINFDLPEDPDNYVHRVGRTGRMGADGVAISFVTPEQGELLTEIEMHINKLIERDNVEGFEAVRQRARKAAASPAAPEPPKPTVPVFGRPVRKYTRRL